VEEILELLPPAGTIGHLDQPVAEGVLYQDAPNGHRSKIAPVEVEFTARACHYGRPGYTDCTNPKIEWEPGG